MMTLVQDADLWVYISLKFRRDVGVSVVLDFLKQLNIAYV